MNGKKLIWEFQSRENLDIYRVNVKYDFLDSINKSISLTGLYCSDFENDCNTGKPITQAGH